jgi:ketosteroid isomerase-like protein
MKKLAIFFFVTAFISTSLFAQESSANVNDVKAKIKKINNTLATMMIKNDHTGMLDYYTDDCISMPSYQPMLRGIEAIKKSSEHFEQSGVKTTAFELTTSDLYPAGEYFIEVGTYTITMQIPGMEMPWDDHGKYVNVWQQFDDGSLKLKLDTWNTDVNPWEQMGGHDEEGGHGESMGKSEMKDDQTESVK